MDKRIGEVNDKVRHEYSLINNRVTWLITSQTIFFGIYAIVYSNQEAINRVEFDKIFQATPWIAITSCIVIYTSILAATWATRLFMKEANIYTSIGPKLTYYMGLTADIFLPMIFISTWLYILTTSVRWPIIFSLIALVFNVWGLYFTESDDRKLGLSK